MASRVDYAVREEGKGETERGKGRGELDGEGVRGTKRTDSKFPGLCRDQKPLEGKASPWAVVV